MGALEWLASESTTLPLLQLRMDELPLPGEARELHVSTATGLVALDEAREGCIGALIRTPGGNALSTTPLLEIRQVYRREVGAMVDLVAVGRASVGSIDQEGRCILAREPRMVCDIDKPFPLEQDALLDELRLLESERNAMHSRLARRGDAACGSAAPQCGVESMDEAAAWMREELCSYDLDRPPAQHLHRLHELWGIGLPWDAQQQSALLLEQGAGANAERQAARQLASFAAFAHAPAMQRVVALGHKSTLERLHYARTCALKTRAKLAAQLAVTEALSPA